MTILSIPIHHDLEMSVALGLSSGDRNWHRLMRGLDNVVAKRVRFSTVGNKSELKRQLLHAINSLSCPFSMVGATATTC